MLGDADVFVRIAAFLAFKRDSKCGSHLFHFPSLPPLHDLGTRTLDTNLIGIGTSCPVDKAVCVVRDIYEPSKTSAGRNVDKGRVHPAEVE
jgi:hypothetical protein